MNNDTSNTCKNKNSKNVIIIDIEPNIRPVFPNPLSPFFNAIEPNIMANTADNTEIIIY